MITLRPLAVVSLSLDYAYNLGNGRIKHYKLPVSVAAMQQQNPVDIIKEFVAKDNGTTPDQVEIELPPEPIKGAFESVGDMPQVLAGHPAIEKALDQQKINSAIYIYFDQLPLSDRLLNLVTIPLNKLIDKINRIWANHQAKKLGFDPNGPIWLYQGPFKSLPGLPVKYAARKVSLCHYLSVVYNQSDEQEAIQILREDLAILHAHGLILGHLAKPFSLVLADVVGSGDSRRILACFLFVDSDKLYKTLGISTLDLQPGLYLNQLGLRTEAFEGGLGYDLPPKVKYEIETVYIQDMIQAAGQEAHIKAWEESYEGMKKYYAAKRAALEKKKQS